MPAVQAAAAAQGGELECEPALGIVRSAYLKATGQRLPSGAFTISYPAIAFDWDFGDSAQTRARLPRLTRLFLN